MRKIQKFLTEYPSYLKCGNKRLAERLRLSETTIAKFKKTPTYRIMRQQYVSELVND